ncbi:MAG: hypothetical protein WD871_03340 [Xanthobacteraceae bacterium]
MTVPRLVAELVEAGREPASADSTEIAELDRRWAAVQAGGAAVPHEHVVRWLRTWGTPAFRRWQAR